ncbi:hypothetical protein BDN67DRAFT_392814 [Paxillus ammoniavirescens]|nr:hypothetical protein BDN67DRAFT_392814 [Paxillus ammoniavirescens]
MDANYRLHRRSLGRRQGLGGVVGGLLGGANTPTSSNVASQNPGLGGIIGGITSIPTISTGSTTTTTSSTSTSSTTSTSTSSHSSTPTPTPTPTSSASDIVYLTTSGDNIVYITSTVPAPSATVTPPKSFLQNPPLEGGVFTIVGIAALIIIFVLVTWTIRKRRHNRLDRDAAAITFDPAITDRYDDGRGNSIEKHRHSGSSSGHGHGFGYGAQPAYAPPLAPPQGYYGHAGYGRYPAAAYRPPSPNPAPYRSPSPAAYGDNTGGANLTRKYSDRKPVPPLLPNPIYDPSHPQVSIPQQYYQEQPLPPAPQVQGGNTMAIR